jgi:hypothetical protein
VLRSLVLLAALALGGGDSEANAPLVRVERGAARLMEAQGVRALDPASGPATLAGDTGWVEAGAASELVVQWRGRASATLRGPLGFTFAREPGLTLESVQVLELEVRRGVLALGVGGVTLELARGALQLRALPDGGYELVNRGASALELRRAKHPPVRVTPGQRVRFRAEPAA